MKKIVLGGMLSTLMLGGMCGFAAAQGQPAESNYVSVRVTSSNQDFRRMNFESSRVTGSQDVASQKERKTTGSVAIGAAMRDGWRGELEYALPQKGAFTSYWAPLTTFQQRVETTAYRLMANGYKDFGMTSDISFNLGAGLGWANVKTRGAQSTVANGAPDSPFATNTKSNLAWSLGFGADFKLNKTHTMGLGYRLVDMGPAESGVNVLGERYKGRLRTEDVSLNWRIAY